MTTISTTTADPLAYQPTRWENVKWHIGYRIVSTALFAIAERTKMLAERAAGEKPFKFEQDVHRHYEWGYRIGQRDAFKIVGGTVAGGKR